MTAENRKKRLLFNYVLRPDHLHAFVATDDQKITLAAWMKRLKNAI